HRLPGRASRPGRPARRLRSHLVAHRGRWRGDLVAGAADADPRRCVTTPSEDAGAPAARRRVTTPSTTPFRRPPTAPCGPVLDPPGPGTHHGGDAPDRPHADGAVDPGLRAGLVAVTRAQG